MTGNVTSYAEERGRRAGPELPELDESTAMEAGDEIAAALARASDIAAPPEVIAASPLEAQWLRFRDEFAEAMEGGLYTVENLEHRILTGDAYFWPGQACAVVAERVVYPTGEAVLQTLWAVGDLEEVLTLEPALAATARLLGCTRVLIEGRKGWERLMKPLGYEPWSVTLCKVL